MRTLLLVVLVGCGSSGTKSADAKSDGSGSATPTGCEATFEAAVDRACGSAADCVLLGHSDCCGAVEIGVSASGQAAAMTAEQQFLMCESAACGGTGCFHDTESEDHMQPGTGQMIVPVCVAQRCSSTVQ